MAGIYIPGGELPKEGHWLIITHDGEVQYVDFTNPYRVLPEKAMEVPNHGKLIDADALPLGENVPTVMMHDGERWISAYELAMAPIIIPSSGGEE